MKHARLENLMSQSAEPQKVNPFYISFSDLMVLLAVFFLMIISMSKIENGSFEKLRSEVTGNSQGTLVELAERMKVIAKNIPQASVRMAPDGVRLDLQTAALFETASSYLKDGSLEPVWPLLKEIRDTNYEIAS